MAFGTDFIFIKGKLSWARIVHVNQFGDWSCTIHPDAESLEVVRELQARGLKNVMKKDQDGYYIQFKCATTRKTKQGGVRPQPAPACVDKEGQPFDGTKIGNGSDGYLKLEVYDFKNPTGGSGCAARLVGVRVDNLVPYEPNRDASAQDQANMDGLVNQKEMLF